MNTRTHRTQVITLTTDFGTEDGYVGAMKGRILSICPHAHIVDISHDIPPQDLLSGALTVMRSAPCFPEGTIHIAVVDPGVGSGRAGLLAECETAAFVAPDNGLLSLVFEEMPPGRLLRIHSETSRWKKHSSFDGLSLFAPVAAHLAQGMDPAEIGEEMGDYVRIPIPQPVPGGNVITGEILDFDRFGNAISNIGAEHLASLHNDRPWVYCGQHRLQVQNHYSQSAEESAQVFALVNSDGLLEVAVYNASAQTLLNLRRGDEVRVKTE